ncbi:hypothetical protein SAMN06265795_101462 [Noviherbaspirillum humi]|uniref:DUF1365 domain-containing protein n=1 Tax=Noviherbaspirillum humi TaxID=1688639 RepID=A0A239CHA0_9BURK|nr:DUF1365 domain-containing protein [Noviherbaspirillum humi]SNS19490.1 hypothetical protein SAMN06265795_101462 [Noviherbaspirillum humi]
MSDCGIQLCLGKVRHKRLRPAVNAFEYGVYFLRLPLRALGQRDFGRGHIKRNRFGLLSFHDADHGDGRQPLLAWIDGLLQAQGIHDADGEIWLQTFPRVLGYVFNPVSFWFCHRADGALRAIVCEVNNTFGERHCYLLDAGGAMRYGVELASRKVFHVSPFCAVAGGYRFRFMQALRERDGAQQLQVLARIDHDDEHGPLIETIISGHALAATDAAVLNAFFRFPLMTLGVVARIHWQALRLWAKRVPFFRKPLPPSHSLSR